MAFRLRTVTGAIAFQANNNSPILKFIFYMEHHQQEKNSMRNENETACSIYNSKAADTMCSINFTGSYKKKISFFIYIACLQNTFLSTIKI
jgi:hypothetical protein